MFPVHQSDLYPHQRNQMQSAPHCHPSFNGIPPQMGAYPERLCYQSWPCSSNYRYVYPAQFHGCCEHDYFPGSCALRSCYAEPPPPYYHGSYFVPPGAYPTLYIPAPHDTVEDTYGYYHCCGCPNHPWNPKVGKNVKIEEEGPHLDNKVDESLVHFNFKNYPNPLVWFSPNCIKNKEENRSNKPPYEKQEDGSKGAQINYPYPVLWFPPNYIMNKEDNKSDEPQCEKQEDDSSNAKVNYPYPVLWFPPNYTRNKEDIVPNEPQHENQEQFSNGSKTLERSKPSEQQRNFVNGWIPLDLNKLRPSKSHSPSQQQQQEGDDRPGFPCPVFWVPYKHDERESNDHKKTDVGQECARRTPSHFEVSPVIVPETEDKTKREMNEEIIGHKDPTSVEKNNFQKTIPLKQAERDEEVKDAEKNEERAKCSGMPLNCSEAGKSSEGRGKRKCSSPPKSSKLPPVCLRVDPLPRKKNSNGGSRSPSPPGDKRKSHEVPRENVKPATSLNAYKNSEEDVPSRNALTERAKDIEQHKSKIKVIQVSEGTGRQGGSGDSLPHSSHEGVVASQTNYIPGDAVEDIAATDVKCRSVAAANSDRAVVEDKPIHSSCQMDEDQEKSEAEEKPANKAKETKRIFLSDAEAARIIQSAYRGYLVRRWEPLKKLKQIMEVSKKVTELKSSIQAFELSPDIQGVDKWRTVIGETIMNLLLKLDTIQGVHPSIRDVRKSVARELVHLQEKVDYLTQKKAETSTQQGSTVLFGEDMDIRDNLPIKERQVEEKQNREDSQSETDPVNEVYPEEACQGERNPRIDAVTKSRNLDIPETAVDKGENLREPISEASTTVTELQKGDPMIDAGTDYGNSDITEMVKAEDQNPQEPITEASSAETELQNSVVFPQVGDQMINPALQGTCSLLKNEPSELKELEELPKGELSEDKSPEDEVLREELPKVFDQNTDMEDNNLVKNEAGENEVLVKRYLESEDLVQLPQQVLENDDDKLDKHLHVEKEEHKGKTDEVTVDESLGCVENEDNNVKFLEMVDLRSKDTVQDPEEETSVDSKVVDEQEVHDKEEPGSKGKVLDCAKSEVHGYFSENEIPAVTTATEANVVFETCEEEVPVLSLMEKESGYKSGENRLTDANNSSSKDASQERDSPVKLRESYDVENEKKQLIASEGAAGVDITFPQPCDSGALEEGISDNIEPVPLEAKQSAEKELPRSSPTASQISLESYACSESDKKLIEENERLREMMQKLIEAGQEQLTAISNLSARVRDLEKRISKKKKLKVRRNGTSRSLSGSSCLKPSNDLLKEKAVALAM